MLEPGLLEANIIGPCTGFRNLQKLITQSLTLVITKHSFEDEALFKSAGRFAPSEMSGMTWCKWRW